MGSGFFYLALAVVVVGFLIWLWHGGGQEERQPAVPLATNIQATVELPPSKSPPAPTNKQDLAAPVEKPFRSPVQTNATERFPGVVVQPATNLLATETQRVSLVPLLSRRVTNPPVSSLTFPRAPRSVFEIQVALARQGISSGSVDGRLGVQTRSALHAYQTRAHLPPTGEASETTRESLALAEPPVTSYTISSNDLARLTPLGPTWLAKSQQSRLDYESLIELVAEKGRAYPSFIRSLNPGVNWSNAAPGTIVTIPNISYPPPRTKAAFLRIRLGEKSLEAFDAATNLIAHFPCSIASRVEKRPVGKLLVEKIASNPSYRFDPVNFPESAEARELGRVLMIPPGPNNPVGTAWIGLNKPGYGIHGTPRPEEVGRTESHGCFRLANWNAEYLLQLVSIGTPVLVEP